MSKIKLLFLFRGSIPLFKVNNNFYAELPWALSQLTELKFYDVSIGRTFYVPEIIKQIYGSDKPDVIYCLYATDGERYTGFNKIRGVKVLHQIDIHSENLNSYLTRETFDIYITPVSEKFLLFPFPPHIKHFTIYPAASSNLFRPENKKFDMVYANTIGYRYDVRNYMLFDLLNPKNQDIKSVILPGRNHKFEMYPALLPAIEKNNQRINILTRKRTVKRRTYSSFLNQSKMMATCTSFYKYPITKIFEAIASKCLLFCDQPKEYTELGLENLNTYIQIELNSYNFIDQIRTFLKNTDKQKEIVERAHKLFLNSHTIEIRAQQIINCIQKAVSGKEIINYNEFDFWNKTYPPDSKHAKSIEVINMNADFIKKHIKGLPKILDFGPGTGRLLHVFKGVNFVEGYDISDIYKNELLKKARTLGINYNLTVAKEYPTILPYKRNEFGAVIASYVLLHQRPQNIVKIMKELARVGKTVIVISHMDKNLPFDNPVKIINLNKIEGGEHCYHYDYIKICNENNLIINDLNFLEDGHILFTYRRAI